MKAQWFNDSYQFSPSELDYLEELRALYPASAPIQVAYLRGLAQHRGSLTALEIETCALRIPNRAELHRLISGLAHVAPVQQVSGKVPEVKSISQSESDFPDGGSVTSAEERTSAAGQLPKETASPTPDIDAKSRLPLEREVLARASAESYAAALLTAEPTAQPMADETPELKRETSASRPQQLDPETNKNAQPDESPVRSFSDWLFATQTTPLKESDVEKTATDGVPQVQDERSIIEQFIRQQPQITPRKPFYSPVEMGKKSLDDSQVPVTETLAMIYMQQSEFKKAAEAFKQLALKFPEKSSYFVALEKEAQSRLNETKKK